MTRQIAIAVDGVSKNFSLPSERRQTLKERVVNPRFDRDARLFRALKDVSFDVERGEFFGIVGRNGSGKSTLLKCLAGIYQLDEGTIAIGGRLSTFIELGVGFNPDLAAKDNIILNGIMLGLTPKQAGARVDEVIEFAELQDHSDVKLKNYSSGMQVRLAFSVMTQIEADVLLIDEVLAVGDASFQAKCFDVFRQLRDQGKTIVLVTHDMSTVSRFCDRAMLLEDGVVVDLGAPEVIGDRYLSLNFERTISMPEVAGTPDAPVTAADEDAPVVAATRALLVNEASELVSHVRTGDRAMVAVDVVAREDTPMPSVTIELRDELDNIVFATSTNEIVVDRDHPPVLTADRMWRFGVWFDALLGTGNLRIRALVQDSLTGRIIERTGDLLRFEVTSALPVLGLANLPHHASWEPIETIEERSVPALTPIGGAGPGSPAR